MILKKSKGICPNLFRQHSRIILELKNNVKLNSGHQVVTKKHYVFLRTRLHLKITIPYHNGEKSHAVFISCCTALRSKQRLSL